jgi:D-glycero-D-manno-heptose 1,7-bisphosphate phosphatase
MPLFLTDRDGVIVGNRRTNIKTPGQLALIAGAGAALARLAKAGFTIAICTNQPEVGRGVLSQADLDRVHAAMRRRLEAEGAAIEAIFCCTTVHKNPRRKPFGGMLDEALARFGGDPAATAFVGDQADDLKAAFHAGCRPFLVKTGLGARTVAAGLPAYVGPVTVCDDLSAVADTLLHEGASTDTGR